jgi:hypothetical protein
LEPAARRLPAYGGLDRAVLNPLGLSPCALKSGSKSEHDVKYRAGHSRDFMTCELSRAEASIHRLETVVGVRGLLL